MLGGGCTVSRELITPFHGREIFNLLIYSTSAPASTGFQIDVPLGGGSIKNTGSAIGDVCFVFR